MSDSTGERKIQLRLFGQDVPIYTSESEEEVDAILAIIQSAIDQTADITSNPIGAVAAAKQAVACCLTLAVNQRKMYKKYESSHQQVTRSLVKLNDDIKKTLEKE